MEYPKWGYGSPCQDKALNQFYFGRFSLLFNFFGVEINCLNVKNNFQELFSFVAYEKLLQIFVFIHVQEMRLENTDWIFVANISHYYIDSSIYIRQHCSANIFHNVLVECNHSCFIVGRSWARFSVCKLAILRIFVVFSVLPIKSWNYTLKQTMTFFYILPLAL